MNFEVSHALLCIRFSAIVGMLLVGFSGCTDRERIDAATPPKNQVMTHDSTSVQELSVELPVFQMTSILHSSKLASVALQLDRAAVVRSPALQERVAAEARLRALKFNQYPQITPFAAVPLNEETTSIGLSIEQVLWDGGRSRHQFIDGELIVVDAALRSWVERNEIIFDGLSAYVEMARYSAKLEAYATLGKKLENLDELLEIRAEGGIADRGERLRMVVALQEVERETVNAQSKMRQAEATLRSLLPVDRNIPPVRTPQEMVDSCEATWPDLEYPNTAIARIRMLRAEAAEARLRAQRLPRLLLGSSISYTANGFSNTGIGLQLDASDMLGFDRRASIDAAIASTQATRVSYEHQKLVTDTELSELDAEYLSLTLDISRLFGLASSNNETLELYSMQAAAGTIPYVEGISLYRENTNVELSLIDLHAELLTNCLRSSSVRGILVPLGTTDE